MQEGAPWMLQYAFSHYSDNYSTSFFRSLECEQGKPWSKRTLSCIVVIDTHFTHLDGHYNASGSSFDAKLVSLRCRDRYTLYCVWLVTTMQERACCMPTYALSLNSDPNQTQLLKQSVTMMREGGPRTPSYAFLHYSDKYSNSFLWSLQCKNGQPWS